MKIYESREDYLETILILQKKNGMVRSVDVAEYREVSKPSVCHAVAVLQKSGFIRKDKNGFLSLTDAGKKLLKNLRTTFIFTEKLLAIGVSRKTAEQDACRIEHVISEESFTKLKIACIKLK